MAWQKQKLFTAERKQNRLVTRPGQSYFNTYWNVKTDIIGTKATKQTEAETDVN